TPYMYITKSGKVPDTIFCGGSNEPGWLYVVKLGSRDKTGERLRSNIGLPVDDIYNSPNLASGEDTLVAAIKFGQDGWPDYMHPGGVQAVGDLLVIGTEDPTYNNTCVANCGSLD